MEYSFIKYGKTERYDKAKNLITITEKIDGTNSQIFIDRDNNITCGSRNRIITPGKDTDNYGFAGWVESHKDEILKLGSGRHYGEWWGEGIQKNRYGVKGKHFSLFNTHRPAETLPDIVTQVPILYHGEYSEDNIQWHFNNLKEVGSCLGGNDPEGIIIYFHLLRKPMKMTYDYKDGKWGNK